MSASSYGVGIPNESTPRCQLDCRFGTTLSRSRCSGEKKFAPTSVEFGFQSRLIRLCIHYTNSATQVQLQHTYDRTGCFVGNTAHFRSEDVRYQSQPKHTISLMWFSAGPLSHSTHIHGTVPPLDHKRFLQNYLHILSRESGFESQRGRLFSKTSRAAPGST